MSLNNKRQRMFLLTPPALLRIVVVAVVLVATSSRSQPAEPTSAVVPNAAACGDSESCQAAVAGEQQRALTQARRAAERAGRDLNTEREIDDWANCARYAAQAIAAVGKAGSDAAALGTSCTDEFLRLALHEGRRWSAGTTRVGGLKVDVELRNLSPYLQDQVGLIRASDVPMNVFAGKRYARAGYGIALVVQSARCHSGPVCDLLPREGVFRGATAWIESAPDDVHADLRLVVADPLRETLLRAGDHRYALALDTSAAYAVGANSSSLRRLGVYGLLGGDEIGRRAGVYLLEDYDPNKRPIVMIHGLAASPLNFARISNAIWGDPQLRAHFQVWHVIYQTDAPLMILRRRIQEYLDRVWNAVDPVGDDPARRGVVLIGHSMGGIIARLLCVESGDVMWNAAFTVPPAQMPGKPEDVAAIENLLFTHPYPGVTRAIFLASPHHGSPAADAWYGRLFQNLIGRGVPELSLLQHYTREHPEVVSDAVRDTYAQAKVNSITTLRAAQPVRAASESLLPQPGIRYHTIAGSLPRQSPPGDGIVPLDSARLPGAESTLVVKYGHQLYDSDEVIAEVVRILHADIAEPRP